LIGETEAEIHAMTLSEGDEGPWLFETDVHEFSALTSDHSINIPIKDIKWKKAGFIALVYKENV
jgi:hypothetical protein